MSLAVLSIVLSAIGFDGFAGCASHLQNRGTKSE
jgi:hypothetical protein